MLVSSLSAICKYFYFFLDILFLVGLIYENELCVKPMDCPCDYHGSFFAIGSVVYEECNNWLVIFLLMLWTSSFHIDKREVI